MDARQPTAGQSEQGPLAIICGGGILPLTVADAVARRGRRVVLFPLHGFADAAAIHRYPHHWVGLGRLGRFRHLAMAEGCRDLVLIGAVTRPRLRQLRLDGLALRHLPAILRSFRGGDDHLLTGVTAMVESLGFRVVGVQDLTPEILVDEGALGRHTPSARDYSDIDRGLALLAATGPFDIGQAAVVADNRILAIEAAEGTDHMLDHVAALRRAGRIALSDRVGVLVKAPKSSQDMRLDLPSIGPKTIEGVVRAGLAGLAVMAGSTIVAEPGTVAAIADKNGIFVVGVRPVAGPS
jgi:hypothetical protein